MALENRSVARQLLYFVLTMIGLFGLLAVLAHSGF